MAATWKRSQLTAAAASIVMLVMLYFEYDIDMRNSLFAQKYAVKNYDDGEKSDNVGVIEELYQVVNSQRLSKIAKDYRQAYADAYPFPHIVIDGIFPKRFLEAVSGEFPEDRIKNGCYNINICFKQATQNKKSAITDENEMGLYTRVFFAFLKSSTWVRFLEELSGINDIIPDPHYRGSGLHVTASGGSLNIHADFNRYQKYQLDRRVNTFVYLNDDWPDSYGGHLELWGRDMKSCYQKIVPSMGRFVVFSSTDFSYHGHPQPITSPEGRGRRSMALYYFTNGRPQNECLNGDCVGNDHSTLFQKPEGCKVCEEATCKRYNETTPYWVTA
mmetsp:Transcript_13998/g.18337  ORF Transcript_13998/g.18337 Transcript_13998/m.18337 type:complete len:330 (+) Transcript_13998:93-1082(+)